jgi:rhamnosyltransferase
MVSNVAIGFITYNPIQSVILRLQDILNEGYYIYIFDNSPEKNIVRDFVKQSTEFSSQIVYLTCGKNAGLGFGLASICAQAYYDSFPALIFFDQDTVFSNVTLNYICNFYNENSYLDKSYSAIVFNSKNVENPDSQMHAVQDVRLAINSGSLYILKNLKKMNWHNIKYFVDCVDYEFCLSSNNFGFKIGENTTAPGFDHTSEQGDQSHKFLGKEYPMRAYPLSRIFDSISASLKLIAKSVITRNFLYFKEINKAIFKYLVIQVFIRVMNVGKSNKSGKN